MKQINVVLDLYSAVICLILYFYLFFGQGKRSRLRRYFMWLCVFNFGMTVGDITNWTCEGFARPWFPAALEAGTLLYWLCSPLLLLSFMAYLTEYLSIKVRVHSGFWCVSAALCVLHVTGSVLSLRNGMFFTITEENIYQRGSWFWLSQFIPLLMYLVDIVLFAVYRKKLSPKDFRILSGYIVIPLAAEVIQMCHYGVSLLNMGVVLALLIIFINIQSERELQMERQEKELVEARINVTMSQIQPHFLYNTLTTIRKLCDIDPNKAKAALLDFSLFLRGNMDSLVSTAPIPFEQELKHTENYLNLEQRRFPNRLHIVYEITVRDFLIPSLTLQPIVENAVRHGVLRREKGGTIAIRTERTGRDYRITVSDDGVGFCPAPPGKPDRVHVGIASVRERLSAMCGGTVEIAGTAGVGTTVTIIIPKEAGKQ